MKSCRFFRHFKMKFKNHKKITVSFIFILILILFPNVFSQSVSTGKKVLPPPMNDLIAVNHPDLKDVEEEVREQIISFQDSLEKATKTSPTTAGKLSDSYGTMGQIYQAYTFLEAAEECYKNASRLNSKD